MKLSEITAETDHCGNLTLPENVLRESGIGPGEKVYLAWIADKSTCVNSYREFFITPNGFIEDVIEAEVPDHGEIEIPCDLLEAAGIDDDDEIKITCIDGAILISRDNSDGLAALLSDYYIKTGGTLNE